MNEDIIEQLPLKKKLNSYPDGRLLVEHQSQYQHIQLFKHPIYGVQLLLNDDLQISESDRAYGMAMVSPLLTLSCPQEIAILGGGDGGVLAEVLSCFAENDSFRLATLVDIDGDVIQLCQKHMSRLHSNSLTHKKTKLVIGDALAFIESSHNLDAVIYDLTMDPIREGFEQTEYIDYILQKISKSLKPNGIISMQCCGQYGETDTLEQARKSLLRRVRESMGKFFVGLVEQHVFIPSYHENWIFFAGVKKTSGE